MDLVPHTNEETEMLRLRHFRIFLTFIELLGEKEKRVHVIIGDLNCSVWVTELTL